MTFAYTVQSCFIVVLDKILNQAHSLQKAADADIKSYILCQKTSQIMRFCLTFQNTLLTRWLKTSPNVLRVLRY